MVYSPRIDTTDLLQHLFAEDEAEVELDVAPNLFIVCHFSSGAE